MMESIYEAYREHYNMDDMVDCLLQKEFMTEEEREAFLKYFTVKNEKEDDLPLFLSSEEQKQITLPINIEEKSLLGFCVMGGIFSEGIDLKQDSLIGVIIVGTGLPMVCAEREILKNYFEEQGDNGFDYAYRYPGMNKVLQAAGRVIRTEEDLGIVALLDERFLQTTYTRLFPREWREYKIVQEKTIGREVEKFWDEWL